MNFSKKTNTIQKTGRVIETLPGTLFRVEMEDGSIILAHLAGRLRIHRIKILAGDKVQVEMTPYDQTKGRITYRGK
jgi:translation initiation factor IF-1